MFKMRILKERNDSFCHVCLVGYVLGYTTDCAVENGTEYDIS